MWHAAFPMKRAPLNSLVATVVAILVCIGLQSASLAAPQSPPVAKWDFSPEETTTLTSHGDIQRDQPGPRPPQFPDFDATNTAVKLDGNGDYYSLSDEGPSSRYDFTNGDAITVEAWVKINDLATNEYHCIIGKGRTGNAGYSRDNQNWAFRVRHSKGKGCLNFLFATEPDYTDESKRTPISSSQWHRWTSDTGFEPGTGWHHVSITYRFGTPESIRGWIDGQPVKGTWDMGGPTQKPPIVDDDEVWIGSSQGGIASNSFNGLIDSIALHRDSLDDNTMKSRFNRVGPAVIAQKEMMPELGPLIPGKVNIMFHEAFPSHTRWLLEDESWPAETLRFTDIDSFILPRIPARFEQWGIRDRWKTPLLVRLAADVDFPEGKHTLLLRARGLSRLWIDGSLIARTGPLTGSPSGEEPITPLPTPLRPGIRLPSYRQQEVTGNLTVTTAGKKQVILETILGGKDFRPEPGELVVAIEPEGSSQFQVLCAASSPPQPSVSNPAAINNSVLLVDSIIEPKLSETRKIIEHFDDTQRRTAAASQNEYWQRRHEEAKAWAQTKLSQIPLPTPDPAEPNWIDRFLTIKREAFLTTASPQAAKESENFAETILPILRDNCFRCHGERALGGLELDSLEAMLQGGDSGEPAIQPGEPLKSELIRRISAEKSEERMPPTGSGLTPEQKQTLTEWISHGAKWPKPTLDMDRLTPRPVLDDEAFLRRVTLDTIGLVPSDSDVKRFLADSSPDKREKEIDRLLNDPRNVDHWMSYWLDLLAENPTLINASLNSTGPFRWFLQDALRDGKSIDRIVTELMMMRGDPHTGGSAGFGLAAENDSPLATKGQIIATAFLGIELQCARCHDSPYHSTTQKDLFALASMLDRKPMVVPKTSRVPAAFFERQGRVSLIRATLKPDESVTPLWPFAKVTECIDGPAIDLRMINSKDSRERLATLITSPENRRFAQVFVNRIWQRLMGIGIVEPCNDWEGSTPSHPQLLEWLALEFVASGYQTRPIERLILTSKAYQRQSISDDTELDPAQRLFSGPRQRRMTAEQVLDSLFFAAGLSMDLEELTFDPDGRRGADNRLSLGYASRAWMLPGLTNERDRPSLNLPKVQAVAAMLEAFGWSGTRQTAVHQRESQPNVLQPGIMANGAINTWITRASYQSPLANLAVTADSPKSLVDEIYLKFLSRLPTAEEAKPLIEELQVGFESRLVPQEQVVAPSPLPPIRRVTWSNHLMPEATTIQLEMEKRARIGPPVDPRLVPQWREIYEDVVWSLINSSEFVYIP